jgi:hypothetical protein
MGPIVDRVGVAGGGRRRWPAPAGLVGFGLASLMVILGTVAGTDSLRRLVVDPKAFYIVPLTNLLILGTCFAFRTRFTPLF